MDQQLNLILELWAPLSPIATKRMFGGYGIFKDDLMFAIFIRGILYLKSDVVSRGDFLKYSLKPFAYERREKSGQTKSVALSYFEAPLNIYDEPQMAVEWAQKALGAAIRNKKT